MQRKRIALRGRRVTDCSPERLVVGENGKGPVTCGTLGLLINLLAAEKSGFSPIDSSGDVAAGEESRYSLPAFPGRVRCKPSGILFAKAV